MVQNHPKNQSKEEKMDFLIQKAEHLANYLLTKHIQFNKKTKNQIKRSINKSTSKSSVRKNSLKKVLEEKNIENQISTD